MIIRCLYDKLIPLSELKPHLKNRNKHPQDQIERLAKILEYQGWRYPVKVSNQSGQITSGHGRVEAAKYLGWTEVPVNFQDYENEDMEYLDVQADNSIAFWSELDKSAINLDILDMGPFDIDLLGIKDFVVEPLEKLEPGCDEDETPEVPKEPITKLGDIYQLGNHRLMCGDSTSIDSFDKLILNEKIDMIYTDPPYGISHQGNIGVPGAGWSGSKKVNTYKPVENDESTEVAKDAFKLAFSICDNLIFWGANYYCDILPEMHSWLVWDKKVIGENYSACELAFTTAKGRIKKFEHQWHGMIKASEMGQARVHPTQKPIALAEWCFENYNNPKSILDLFGGSGSTLIACEKTNRKCFMMELDPKYCDVIVARWEKYTGKKAELISNGET